MTYGPIDFLALEFTSQKLRGEILPALLDLVQSRTIRVVDLIIVRKNIDGTHEAIELQELNPELMAVFDPLEVEISGIVQAEDIAAIADAMADDTTAAILLFENLWAVRFKEAVLRAEGRLIAQERIPNEVLEEVLEIFAEVEGGNRQTAARA